MNHESAFWRRLAWLGASRGPRALLRWSPGPIGLAFALASRRQRTHLLDVQQTLLGSRPAISAHLDVARTFVQFAHSLAETLALSTPDRYEPTLLVHGAEHITPTLDRAGGFVAATAHTAGWEIALRALQRTARVPIAVAMRPEREARARSFHPVIGSGGDVHVVSVGDDPLSSLPLLTRLRSGGVVAVQVDRAAPGMRCFEIEEGHRLWRLPRGPFLLASAADVPLFLVLTRRTGFFDYVVRISPPLSVPSRAGEDALLEAARSAARDIAGFVRQYPTQWFDFAPG